MRDEFSPRGISLPLIIIIVIRRFIIILPLQMQHTRPSTGFLLHNRSPDTPASSSTQLFVFIAETQMHDRHDGNFAVARMT